MSYTINKILTLKAVIPIKSIIELADCKIGDIIENPYRLITYKFKNNGLYLPDTYEYKDSPTAFIITTTLFIDDDSSYKINRIPNQTDIICFCEYTPEFYNEFKECGGNLEKFFNKTRYINGSTGENDTVHAQIDYLI